MQITDTQWNKYLNKYKKLMYKISHMISGDLALAAQEENYADLVVSAIESIEGYHNKTGKSIDDMLDDPLFDKYTKTCLWNKKNNKGALITKKSSVLKNNVSISEIENEFLLETNHYNVELEIEEALVKLTPHQLQLVNVIAENPSLVKQDGTFNVSAISEALNISLRDARARTEEIERILKNGL